MRSHAGNTRHELRINPTGLRGDLMAQEPSAQEQVRRRLAWMIPLILILALILRFWPALTPLDRIELRTIDWRFIRRGPRPPDPRIVIVEVDESSIARIGRWPWPRRRFAQIIRILDRAGARAVVCDIFFADPDTNPGGAASDRELIAATREAGMVFHAAFGHPSGSASNVDANLLGDKSWDEAQVIRGRGVDVVAQIFEPGKITGPLPGLAEAAAGVGFVNVADSGDGVFRHIFPIIRFQGRLYPSLALATAAAVLDVSPSEVVVWPGHWIKLGDERRIPIDRSGRMLVDFAGGTGTYPYVSVRELLEEEQTNPLRLREQFEDKIVLVAVSAPGLYDLRASPFDTVYNGAETQANALANILEGQFLRQAPGEVSVAVMITLAAIMLIGLSCLRPAWAIGFVVAVIVGYNWLCLDLFRRGLVLEMTAPNLVMILSAFAALSVRLMGEQTEHERAREALARFVPSAVVERAIEEDAAALLKGHRRIVTVMFADIRNFTVKSEQMPPEQTVELLNRFFQLVHETIWEFQGTLDKYMGDGLMAFWNSPLEQPDHALLAVQTAVHMQRRIRYNQAEWEFYGMPDLAAGIGISTGEVVVGYVGTGERMQYTAIGAHVNLAARLEAMTKELGAPILVSRSTWELVAHAVEGRSLGLHEVRGFSEPIEIFEIIDLKS